MNEIKNSVNFVKLSEMDNDTLEDLVCSYIAENHLLAGSNNSTKDQVVYYELYTKLAEFAHATIYWNPSNQPKEDGKIKIGIVVDVIEQHGELDEDEYFTILDEVVSFKDDESIKDIAEYISKAVNTSLSKF